MCSRVHDLSMQCERDPDNTSPGEPTRTHSNLRSPRHNSDGLGFGLERPRLSSDYEPD